MDFLSHAALEGQHYDPTVTTGIQGYNKGMAEIRARVGGALFISESVAPIFPAQYAHSRRIACDAFGTTSSTEYELNSLTYGWWQNKSIYKHIDMDSMDLLTNNIETARTVVNATAISGGLILDGNNLIDGNQLSLAENLLLNSSINGIARMGKAFRAVDGNTGTSASSAFALSENGTNYVALFNYSTSTATVSVSLVQAGLSGTKSYTVKDLWTGSSTSATGTLSVSLASGQSKVYSLQ
jgi:alpha-galactosidase